MKLLVMMSRGGKEIRSGSACPILAEGGGSGVIRSKSKEEWRVVGSHLLSIARS
jgi:hypothetical protein